MNVTWGLLTVLSVVCHTESRCSPTAYYKNCWIRRFPGIFIDIEESQRRGAQLLKNYQEETALKCSRTCCLTRNFSCNLAIFHYDAAQENINCFHLHCPTLESCILSHRGNVVLYNVTKGVDPDLLVFGKYFTSNVRLLPHIFSRANVSEPLPSDKRHFLHPPPPAALPPTPAPTVKANATASEALTTAGASMLHSPNRPSTTTSAFTSISPTPLTDLGSHMQTTAPATTATTTTTTTTDTPASSFMTSSSTITDTSLSKSNPDTNPVFSTTTAQPFTSTAPQPDTTSSYQSATSSPTTTASTDLTEVSKQYPNDTKDTVGRNHTIGDEGVSGEDISEGPGWHAAAHILLVAVAACITILLSCCCSILLVVSWRGQRKRMGRYRTAWRGKRGSMRLIKYVLVRETS